MTMKEQVAGLVRNGYRVTGEDSYGIVLRRFNRGRAVDSITVRKEKKQ